MSVLWSENGKDWERKQSSQFRPFRPRLTASDIVRRAAEKPPKRNWLLLGAGLVCLGLAGWLFVILWMSL